MIRFRDLMFFPKALANRTSVPPRRNSSVSTTLGKIGTMRRRTLLAAIAAVGTPLAIASPVNAADYTFTTIDVPGAFDTMASGINNAGQIVGGFDNLFGFLYTGGSFTGIDVPGAIGTVPSGINNTGQVVGFFGTGSPPHAHGFVDTGGSFAVIDDPGADSNGTKALGINDAGMVVGYLPFIPANFVGFLYNSGNFSTINPPDALVTEANGINDSGQIVGFFFDGTGWHSFLDTGGSFATVDVPGESNTQPYGINNAGQIVGDFGGAGGGSLGLHGFLYRGGNFTTTDVPGASFTEARGINDAGQIVGIFYDGHFRGSLATPVARFAGTPGKANCLGQSVSALAQQFGGLNNAAAALGFASVSALQNAIMAFCEG